MRQSNHISNFIRQEKLHNFYVTLLSDPGFLPSASAFRIPWLICGFPDFPVSGNHDTNTDEQTHYSHTKYKSWQTRWLLHRFFSTMFIYWQPPTSWGRDEGPLLRPLQHTLGVWRRGREAQCGRWIKINWTKIAHHKYFTPQPIHTHRLMATAWILGLQKNSSLCWQSNWSFPKATSIDNVQHMACPVYFGSASSYMPPVHCYWAPGKPTHLRLESLQNQPHTESRCYFAMQ